MNVEALVWTFIYMGIAVGILAVCVAWAAVFFENKE